ncbi:hypothetical protein L3X38_036189 [Prunus dulcis]|uniref:Uncharacterized protein n=1 Tax=Prunus dulcis TaxID=3755 RepID=A0AAD4V2P9_PRUDU|nr:hypothetical protein L3X38_036189 [Prunus dulcis]
MEKGSFKSAFFIVLFLVSYDGVQFGAEARGPIVRYPCQTSALCGPCTCVENWCKCPPDKISKFILQDISTHPQAQPEMP